MLPLSSLLYLKCLEHRSAVLKLVNPSSTKISISLLVSGKVKLSQKHGQILKVL